MDNLLYRDLLETFHTASILIDTKRQIKYAFGKIQAFLDLPTGRAY